MEPGLLHALAGRFIRWCQAGNAPDGEAEAAWLSLSSRYQEPHRYYHDLSHVAASLAELDGTGQGTRQLEGAIWFHDVIYDPVRADNEATSVAWFEDVAGAWLAPETRCGIARLISATDFRLPRSDDPDEALMVDIDLAVLSAEPGIYDAYRRAIRREYAHVPDEAYRAGRAKVMSTFLAAPIYRTAGFSGRESRARENIVWELELLEKG